eukprot:3769788-Prymnesium_polylepis.2
MAPEPSATIVHSLCRRLSTRKSVERSTSISTLASRIIAEKSLSISRVRPISLAELRASERGRASARGICRRSSRVERAGAERLCLATRRHDENRASLTSSGGHASVRCPRSA